MTQNYPVAAAKGSRRSDSARPSPLSLRQAVPAGWHQDRLAFAGDPDFDWESAPEPPRASHWLTEARPARRPN